MHLFFRSDWIWGNLVGNDFILIEGFFFVVVVVMQELQDKVEKVKDSNEELMREGREIVDFHGEMVLLENYSALNYTGTCHLFPWLVKPHDLCGLTIWTVYSVRFISLQAISLSVTLLML